MSKSIGRRQFLKGGAALVGGSLMVGVPGTALEALAFGAPSVVPSMFFWDGTRFILSQRLSSGDETLERVQIRIQSFGEPSRLQAIDQVATLAGESKPTQVPFLAWTAPPRGVSVCQIACDVRDELVLRLHLIDGSVDFPLTLGSGSKRKLREGTYVIAFGGISGYRYEQSDSSPIVNGNGPMAGEHVVVTITRD